MDAKRIHVWQYTTAARTQAKTGMCIHIHMKISNQMIYKSRTQD